MTEQPDSEDLDPTTTVNDESPPTPYGQQLQDPAEGDNDSPQHRATGKASAIKPQFRRKNRMTSRTNYPLKPSSSQTQPVDNKWTQLQMQRIQYHESKSSTRGRGVSIRAHRREGVNDEEDRRSFLTYNSFCYCCHFGLPSPSPLRL